MPLIKIVLQALLYILKCFQEKAKPALGRRVHIPQVCDNIISEGIHNRTPEGLRRIRGTHSSFSQHSEFNAQRPAWPAPPNHNGNHNGTSIFQSKPSLVVKEFTLRSMYI